MASEWKPCVRISTASADGCFDARLDLILAFGREPYAAALAIDGLAGELAAGDNHRRGEIGADERLRCAPLASNGGHADLWQVCLAHQLRDCQYAIEAGDEIFAPRMKMLLLRAVVLARRRKELAETTRRSYQCRLDRDLNAIMVLAPVNQHGKRLRKRYGKVRSHLFTFLEHPDVPPDNNGSERELRPTATYRKVTGGFRSHWGADLFADIRSVLGTAARHKIDAYQAVLATLRGGSVLQAG